VQEFLETEKDQKGVAMVGVVVVVAMVVGVVRVVGLVGVSCRSGSSRVTE